MKSFHLQRTFSLVKKFLNGNTWNEILNILINWLINQHLDNTLDLPKITPNKLLMKRINIPCSKGKKKHPVILSVLSIGKIQRWGIAWHLVKLRILFVIELEEWEKGFVINVGKQTGV